MPNAWPRKRRRSFVQSLRRSRRTVRSAGATPGHAGLPATEPDSLPLRLQPGARRGQELARQTAELLNARPLEPRLFDRQIAFNLLAQVGAVDAEGHSAIERRIFAEVQALRRRIGPLNVTCIQAPVFFGDSLSVTLQCAEPVDLAAVTRVLDDERYRMGWRATIRRWSAMPSARTRPMSAG